MKTLFFLSVAGALIGAPAWSAPCEPGSLASYIAMGTAGCTLGSLTVSGFSYQAQARGAAKITADQIKVSPLLAPTGSYGLQFSAPWDVQSGQAQASGIGYRVLSPSTSQAVQQVRLDGTGFKAELFASAVVNEYLATMATTSTLEIYLKCMETCSSQTSDMANFTPAVPMLVVLDRVQLQSKQGEAALPSFADWFVACLACV